MRTMLRGGAVWQLVWLITRRSQLQILPPLPLFSSSHPPRMAAQPSSLISANTVIRRQSHATVRVLCRLLAPVSGSHTNFHDKYAAVERPGSAAIQNKKKDAK